MIAAACSAGAASVTQNPEVKDKFWSFGELIGIAFQIKDDLFDYGTDDVGKPLGIDIKEQKMTLPLIHVLQKSPAAKKRWIKNIIKRHHNNKKKVNELIQYVKDNGGMEYARSKMLEYRDKALELLDEFPQNEAKLALADLVNFSINRKK